MIKKATFVIILILFLTGAYAMGSARDVSMDTIEAQLTAKTDLSRMAKCSDRDLMQFLGLDARQFDSYIYYKGTEALSVEELLIIKGVNADDLSGAEDAVESRVQSQIKTFEGYGPAQVAMLNNAIITVKGNYLFYCTAETPEVYEEVYKDVIQ